MGNLDSLSYVGKLFVSRFPSCGGVPRRGGVVRVIFKLCKCYKITRTTPSFYSQKKLRKKTPLHRRGIAGESIVPIKTEFSS